MDLMQYAVFASAGKHIPPGDISCFSVWKRWDIFDPFIGLRYRPRSDIRTRHLLKKSVV